MCGTPVEPSLLSSRFWCLVLPVHRVRYDSVEDVSVPDTRIPCFSSRYSPYKKTPTPPAAKKSAPIIRCGTCQEVERILHQGNRREID
jgi:hypothetical protein